MIRVLYVEDEPFLSKIVKETLESKKYLVTLVEDGGLAIDAYKSGSFDVCVLDIMLPNKSGYEVATEIRDHDKNIPILFLSAKDQTGDVLKGFEVGCNDYIRKPFSMEELMVRIDNFVAILRSRENTSLESVNLGPSYLFNPLKLELSYGKKSRRLSHRETEIIKILVINKNKVTHRKDILLEIWGDDSFYNSRNLDVYITKIRGYFKKDPAIKIATLKGVGYQFVVPV